MTTPEERDAIEYEEYTDPNAEILALTASRDSLIESRDDALDRIEELKQLLTDAEATIEHLRESLALTQNWLTETSAENIELRTRVHERDVWLNAAAGTIERYGTKYGPLSEL